MLVFQVADEFKHHAREHKFVVRDFAFNETDLNSDKNEISRLVTNKKKSFVSISILVLLACICKLLSKGKLKKKFSATVQRKQNITWHCR